METTSHLFTRHDLSSFFYDMPENDFQSLKDSISKHGVLNPIVLHDDEILDGWHRYKACQELSIPCPYVFFSENYPDMDVKDFVIAQNKERKSLTQSQMALAITQVADWMPTGVKKKDLEEGPHSVRTLTAKEIADKSGTSVRTIEQAKKVIRDASDELKEAVKEGKIGLAKAYAISKLPKEEQADAIVKPLAKRKLRGAENTSDEEDPYQVIARLEKERDELWCFYCHLCELTNKIEYEDIISCVKVLVGR